MKKIAGTRASASTQSYTSEAGQPIGNFVEPDETANPPVPGTVVTARWAQEVQSELTGTIEACGATLANGAQLPALLGLKSGVTGGQLGNLGRVQADSYSTTIPQPATEGDSQNIRFPHVVLDRNSNCSDSAGGFRYTAQRAQRVRVKVRLALGFTPESNGTVLATILLSVANTTTSAGFSTYTSSIIVITSNIQTGYAYGEAEGYISLANGQAIGIAGQAIISGDSLTTPVLEWGLTVSGNNTGGAGCDYGCTILIEEMPEIP